LVRGGLEPADILVADRIGTYVKIQKQQQEKKRKKCDVTVTDRKGLYAKSKT
jgi:hypothetical protein